MGIGVQPCLKDCRCNIPIACAIFADPFDRADSIDLGPNYTLFAGSLGVSSGEAVASSANSLAVAAFTSPTGTAGLRATVRAKGATGDIIRLVLNHDGTNYHYVEVTVGAAGTLKLVSTVDGVLASHAVNIAANVFFTMTACMAGGVFIGSGGGTTLGAIVDTAAAPRKAGLAVGGTAVNVHFDDFTVEATYDAILSPHCRGCGFSCLQNCETFPLILKVRIYNAVNDVFCSNCAAFEGVYLLEYQGEFSLVGQFYSLWSAPLPATICGLTGTIDLKIQHSAGCECFMIVGDTFSSLGFNVGTWDCTLRTSGMSSNWCDWDFTMEAA